MGTFMILINGNDKVIVESDSLIAGDYYDQQSGLSYSIIRQVKWADLANMLRHRFEDNNTSKEMIKHLFELAQCSGRAEYVFADMIKSLVSGISDDDICQFKQDARSIRRAELAKANSTYSREPRQAFPVR